MRFAARKPGSALLAAAMLATLLATAAATLTAYTGAARKAATQSLRLAQARLTAQGLIDQALVLIDRKTSLGAFNGGAIALPDLPTGAALRIQDTAGLIDLNASQPPRLQALFAALGLPTRSAAELADRIADWRDPDDIARASGAEASAYAAQHKPGLANAPFTNEEQLADVLGVSPALAACAGPYLTVFPGSDFIDPAVAPAPVRAAIEARGGNVGASALGEPIGRVLIMTATTKISASAALRLTEWVRLTGDARQPVLIHRVRTDFAPLADASQEACAAMPAGSRS